MTRLSLQKKGTEAEKETPTNTYTETYEKCCFHRCCPRFVYSLTFEKDVLDSLHAVQSTDITSLL